MENDGGKFTSETARAAGRKSRGGGRPRRALGELMDQGGSEAIEHLLRILAQGEEHTHYFDALRELSRTCLPKRRATEMAVSSEPITFVDLARQLADEAAS